MERFRPIQEYYNGKLAEAVPLKRDESRAVSLETLFTDGSQTLRPRIRKILVGEFASLPEPVQWRLLMRWPEIGGPDMGPALRSIASRPGAARDVALEHLLEMDPGATRQLIVARIRDRDLGDPRSTEPRVLLSLPDERLPELDSALVAALDHGTIGPALVARYASDAVLPHVMEWLERNPQKFCYTAISAYLFRTGPARAKQQLAEARSDGSCMLHMPQYATCALMTPGLEQAAIDSLADADPAARRAAQPASFSASFCRSRFCSSVDTRA